VALSFVCTISVTITAPKVAYTIRGDVGGISTPIGFCFVFVHLNYVGYTVIETILGVGFSNLFSYGDFFFFIILFRIHVYATIDHLKHLKSLNADSTPHFWWFDYYARYVI